MALDSEKAETLRRQLSELAGKDELEDGVVELVGKLCGFEGGGVAPCEVCRIAVEAGGQQGLGEGAGVARLACERDRLVGERVVFFDVGHEHDLLREA